MTPSVSRMSRPRPNNRLHKDARDSGARR